ncbi:MAG: hypothetical protein KAX64_00635 [Chromatiaceae bacterium]|nr:hypothetical protein [Chromatiaceae bacterium]
MSGFDAHRVGDYADIAPHYGRRCLADAEFEANGFHLRPHDDLWSKVMSEKSRARLAKLQAGRGQQPPERA